MGKFFFKLYITIKKNFLVFKLYKFIIEIKKNEFHIQ